MTDLNKSGVKQEGQAKSKPWSRVHPYYLFSTYQTKSLAGPPPLLTPVGQLWRTSEPVLLKQDQRRDST